MVDFENPNPDGAAAAARAEPNDNECSPCVIVLWLIVFWSVVAVVGVADLVLRYVYEPDHRVILLVVAAMIIVFAACAFCVLVFGYDLRENTSGEAQDDEPPP
ncbi:hypothetical protein ACP4OV_019403 [Aristida adscensionis]